MRSYTPEMALSLVICTPTVGGGGPKQRLYTYDPLLRPAQGGSELLPNRSGTVTPYSSPKMEMDFGAVGFRRRVLW
jgi:hypothetical protein